MKKIIIDKSLFNLHSNQAKGMIVSVNKLFEKGFDPALYPNNIFEDPVLQRLFDLESISFKHWDEYKKDDCYFVSSKKYKNISAKYILVGPKSKSKSIEDAVNFILSNIRFAKHYRDTNETKIKLSVNLDGKGHSKVKTGIGFFDHMLEQLSKHSNIDMNIFAKGDLHIDYHHTVEDVGITLGECLVKALGDKKGIKRFGFMLPMDDGVAQTSIDLSGRSYLNFRVKFARNEVGDFPTELVEEFFRGLNLGMKANIFIKASGKNDHHIIESIFKSFAKTLNEAVRMDPRASNRLPTTKGKL